MSGIITRATEWEILPETFANPIQRVKLPRKWEVREKRILSPEETARIEEPNRPICDTCLDTGTRKKSIVVDFCGRLWGYCRRRQVRGSGDTTECD